jgi:hypothetical protein
MPARSSWRCSTHSIYIAVSLQCIRIWNGLNVASTSNQFTEMCVSACRISRRRHIDIRSHSCSFYVVPSTRNMRFRIPDVPGKILNPAIAKILVSFAGPSSLQVLANLYTCIWRTRVLYVHTVPSTTTSY